MVDTGGRRLHGGEECDEWPLKLCYGLSRVRAISREQRVISRACRPAGLSSSKDFLVDNSRL